MTTCRRRLAVSSALGLASTVFVSLGVVAFWRYQGLPDESGRTLVEMPAHPDEWLWLPAPVDQRRDPTNGAVRITHTYVPTKWSNARFGLLEIGCEGTGEVYLNHSHTSSLNQGFAINNYAQREISSGWPFYALRSRWSSPSATMPRVTLERGVLVWPLPAWDRCQPVALPLRPLAAGFIGDSVLFGAGWYGVLGLMADQRSSWRARRGRCGHCGYQAAGLDPCPECGRSI